ncbi:YdeI/OmpD-associated family protein [Candidatus Micrarchaeota archaeon]|nr:YdeI/OmpD-associated family protein [Candidatus Micrarchaeota archaeon]
MRMELGKTLYVHERKAWRSWLSRNRKKEKEIWLIYYKKSSGKPRIPYNDAVEEALCFGWIDSTVKKIDDERFAQRFTPRGPRSGLSQANRERIREMISEGKMTKAGLAAVSHAFDAGKSEMFAIPKSILAAIRKDRNAWKNFAKLPEKYKRVRLAYLESRKRHGMDEFKKSLRHFIKMTAKNKRFGFVR